MREKYRDWLLTGLLFLSGFVFMGGMLFLPDGEIIAGSDLHWIFRATGAFAAEAWQQGQMPLWNPYIFLGLPQFAEPQLSTFYPPMWLLAVASPAFTFAFLYGLHIGLAAAGGYVLLRQLGGKWSGALLTGVIIGYMPFMLVRIYAGHFPHLMTLAYMPWLLAAATWAAARPHWARAVLAAIPLALAMLAGYAPFFPFLVGGVTIWFFWLAFGAWRDNGRSAGLRVLGQWLIVGVSAGLMAAVQLLPTLQFTLLSSRVAGADYAFASSLSLPFWALLRFFLPEAYGAAFGSPAYWAPDVLPTYWEYMIYVGILPLLLLLLGIVYSSQRRWFWLGLALLGLLLALGPAAALHRLFYEFVPGFGLFRVPARFIYFFGLGTAVVAGFAFDYWFDLPPEKWRQLKRWLRAILLIFLTIAGAAIVASLLLQAAQTEMMSVQRLSNLTNQLLRLALWGTLALLLLLVGYGKKRGVVVAFAVLLLLADLWGYGRSFLVSQEDVPEIAWVLADLVLPEEREDFRVLAEKLGNGNILVDLFAVDGYDDFRTETGHKLSLLALEDERVARMLSARYFLELYNAEPTTTPGWVTLTEPAGVRIYEREDALPRTWLVYDVRAAADTQEALSLIAAPELDFTKTAVVQVLPDTSCDIQPGASGTAQITHYGNEEVVVLANSEATGWLVLNDLYYPGWQATVDGETVPIQPTNYGLRGVCVPAGAHEVVFRFAPPVFWIGLALSVVGWLLALVAFVIVFRHSSSSKT